MALRSQLEFAFRLENKDFQWPDSTEDIFDSLIDPEAFHLPNGETQRKYSNNFINFFEAHASSNGSGALNVFTIPDLHSDAWHFSALSIEHEDAVLKRPGRHLSIYSALNGSPARSETDLVVLPTDDVEDECTHAITAPSTPHWRTKSRKLLDGPVSVHKRKSSVSPSKVKKTQGRVINMRRVPPQKATPGGTILTKRFQDAAAAGQPDVEMPMSKYALATPPPSTQLRSGSFEWGFSDDQEIRSSGLLYDEFDSSLSPLSNGRSQLQHQNSRVGTPCLQECDGSPRLSRAAEPHHKQMSSYASSPLDPHEEIFSPVPPVTQPMSNSHWSPTGDPFMQQIASPDLAGTNKAEPWFTGMGTSEAIYSAPAALSNGFGLGISCTDDDTNRGCGLDFGGYSSSTMQGSHLEYHSLMQHTSPAPRARSTSRQLTTKSSTSALSPDVVQSMYPISPSSELVDHSLGYTFPPARQQQAFPAYSPSAAQMPARQTYRPSHHRSHTIGDPISSNSPSMRAQPTYASMSFDQALPSPSPSPSNNRSVPIPQRGGKPAHHRRKSSSAIPPSSHNRQASTANVDFVNFTPEDSKKILMGVAPSGSSKTKARREREAAEKRRKLGEVAKKAVLDAGGNLEAVEEVLALSE